MPKPMRANSAVVASRSSQQFPFFCCRNISGPDDLKCSRRVLAGHAPATSFIGLDDDENVREYLVNAQGKQKQSPTLVHQAIRKTLRDTPDVFSILNSGITLVASAADIDETKKVIELSNASIINGSQTQGELIRFLSKEPEYVPHVKFEIIVTEDRDLVAEIAIARNFQNDVRAISIAGRRGQLDELEASLQKANKKWKLRKSESEMSDEYIDTEKFIQVLMAITPQSLWIFTPEGKSLTSKVFTYSQKTRCLKLFQKIEEQKESEGYRDLYKFFLDMAGPAWSLYEKWRTHQGFIGTRLRKIEREDGLIVEVPDGIIFPIIAAYASFCGNEGGKWKFHVPKLFDEKRLIKAAADDYTNIADSNPQTMGKKTACYSRLLDITQLYAELN